MSARVTRRQFTLATASIATIGFVRYPGNAAQFEYKWASGLPTPHPANVRASEMWAAVKQETNGQLDVASFPNGQLGNEAALLEQVRSGAIQFDCQVGAQLASVVPAAGIEGVGFAFASPAQAVGAMDGGLGDYLRKEISDRGLVAYRSVFDLGMRELISRTKPIVTIADMQGFKVRCLTSKITIDMFTTLGAAPNPLSGTVGDYYTAVQTGIVDGEDFPLATLEASKHYEVTKFVSLTHHQWIGYWLLAHPPSVAALPPNVRAAVVRNNEKFVALQRKDMLALYDSLRKTLEGQGMTFNAVDTKPFRAKLAPFYARWRPEFGDLAWGQLEKSVGKFGLNAASSVRNDVIVPEPRSA